VYVTSYAALFDASDDAPRVGFARTRDSLTIHADRTRRNTHRSAHGSAHGTGDGRGHGGKATGADATAEQAFLPQGNVRWRGGGEAAVAVAAMVLLAVAAAVVLRFGARLRGVAGPGFEGHSMHRCISRRPWPLHRSQQCAPAAPNVPAQVCSYEWLVDRYLRAHS